MSKVPIITNAADIERVVRDAVRQALSGTLPDMVAEATRPKYYTPESVRELTGWSPRTLQHLRDTRQVEFIQHSRKILYPSKELHDFLERHRIVARKAEGRA